MFTLSQLLSKVTHMLQFFYIKCSICSPCCGTTHSSRRHHWPMAWSMKRCNSLPTQWRLPASAGWLSWIVDVARRPSVKGTPNSAIDWIQVRAVWGPHVRLDERDVLTPLVRRCSWQCVTARRPAADICVRCQRYCCRMWQLLWTITETINTLFLVNLLYYYKFSPDSDSEIILKIC